MLSPESVLLLLFDVDDCLFHRYDNKKSILNWLIPSNARLLDGIVSDIQSENYDCIIVANGAKRQDLATDSCNPGGTCSPVLPIIQSYLQARTGANVQLDQFLMADAYRNKPAGSSYKDILKEIFCGYSLAHDQAILDRSKISLIYAHAHRVALLNPNATRIIIDFFDDADRIMMAVFNFFSNYPDFLPRQVSLRIHQYPATQGEYPFNHTVIEGQGEIDSYYTWFVRYLTSIEKLGRVPTIESADALKRYHDARCYNASNQDDTQMHVYVRGGIDVFRAFRDKELPLLGNTDIDKSQQAAYTTALTLYAEGYIPGEFVLNVDCKKGIIPLSDIHYLATIKSTVTELFTSYINGWSTFFRWGASSKAKIVLNALSICRDLTDMTTILNRAVVATDNIYYQELIQRAKEAVAHYEDFIATQPGSFASDLLASQACALPVDENPIVATSLSSSYSQRLIEAEPIPTYFAEEHYSYHFVIFIREKPYWNFTAEEQKLHDAYKKNWAFKHHDPTMFRFKIIPISPADDIRNKDKYHELTRADHRSRITILGHHEMGSEYLSHNNINIHFTKIIDLIRFHVQSDTVLLQHPDDLHYPSRALRINLIACNAHFPGDEDSLASKMFHYATNHPEKRLRIEISAPQMYVMPTISTTQTITNRSNEVTLNAQLYQGFPHWRLHRRYGASPLNKITGSNAGIFSLFYPAYKPSHRKALLVIDTDRSTPEQIVPDISSCGR